ncbi:MAG: solute:Na+ symporter, family [Archaeoglobi archaeon]|nr:solute:Na+ symporter, family [Archaeoglobi archaeon]
MRSEIILFGLLLWFGFGASVALLSRRLARRSSSDFFIAQRSVSGVIAAMTYSATTYSAFMMVGLVGYVYATGVGAIGFELTYLLGTVILLLIFAPRFWIAGKLRGYISPAELLSDRYGSRAVGAVFAVISLIMLIPYSSVQFTGIAYLLQTVSGGEIDFLTSLVIAYVIILIFTLWGLRSVAWTDALQASIMLASSLMFLFILISRVGGLSEMFSTLQNTHPELLYANSWDFMKFLGLTVPWFFFALSNPQVSQRLFIARDAKSLRTMILGFSAFGLIYTLIVGLIGLSSRILLPSVQSSDLVMPALLSSEDSIIALIVLLGIIGAAISTLNSIILTLSSMFVRDIFGALGGISEEREILIGKLLIPVIAFLALVFSYFRFGLIVELSVASSAGLLSAVPSALGALVWRRGGRWSALISILSGSCAAVLLYSLSIFPFGLYPGVWVALISFSSYFLLSLFERAPSELSGFLDEMKAELRKRGMD